ncbi:hypothetical protein AB0N71_18765 [Pseudarthrobacter enclensis]|uniref:hypothetical protein n=1 Tax=Pseudarthrobacter enclensis TaxID=993070 RepID=UPI003442F8C0
MTTGAKHQRMTEISLNDAGEERRYYSPCRCAIGADHDADVVTVSELEDDEDENDEGGEPLSVYDAADIWRSHGEDSHYAFGYSEDELRRAADDN